MIPPAIRDPLVWAILVVGFVTLLVSTVLYRPIERFENRLHLPQFGTGKRLRVIGAVAGATGISIALLIFYFG